MMHDFAQLHNRHTGQSSKLSRSKSLLVIAGLLLVAVGAKHLAERGEGPAPLQSATTAVAQPDNAGSSDVASKASESVKSSAKQQAALANTTPVDSSRTSLLKQIVGEANGAGFEFYDMLKHAWPKANEMVTEVKESPMLDQAAFLQVASYREVDDAEKLRKKLSAMGLDASVETGGSDSGTRWFRVFVGPFSSEAKLKKAESALVKMSFSPVPSNR